MHGYALQALCNDDFYFAESKVPGPPQNVQVKTSSDEATLWWDPPANADEVLVRGYTLSYGIGTPSLTTVIEGVDSNAFTINFLGTFCCQVVLSSKDATPL
jgi:hypothetical protein